MGALGAEGGEVGQLALFDPWIEQVERCPVPTDDDYLVIVRPGSHNVSVYSLKRTSERSLESSSNPRTVFRLFEVAQVR